MLIKYFSYGLQFLPSEFILQKNFNCERILIKNLLAFLGMIITYYLTAMGFALYSQAKMMWVYLLCQLGISIQQSIYWLTPIFIIQILLENFNIRCNSHMKRISFENCKKNLDIFAFFSKSFKTFLLVYFTFTQIYVIFLTFTILSQMLKTDFLNQEGGLLGISGQFGHTLSLILAFNITTGEIENSFEILKGLKTPIQERLLQCPGEVEKAQMTYLLQRIEDLKPMNACGYFEIGKSTLTSMLSVRFDHKTLDLQFKFNIFSLTYIIILVQFKMSADGGNCDHLMNANITSI